MVTKRGAETTLEVNDDKSEFLQRRDALDSWASSLGCASTNPRRMISLTWREEMSPAHEHGDENEEEDRKKRAM